MRKIYRKLKKLAKITQSNMVAAGEAMETIEENSRLHRNIARNAIESFYRTLDLPEDKIPFCRFLTKQRLLDLYEEDIVYKESKENGCVFRHLRHGIDLFIPFVGFDEYIGLCWDVFVEGYSVNISRPFIFLDIGSNLLNASLLFASNPLCKRAFAYEIIPATYRAGLTNLELNPELETKISSFNHGLYDADTKIEATHFRLRPGSSGVSERLDEQKWLAETLEHDFIASGNREQLIVTVKEVLGVTEKLLETYPNDDLIIKIDAENSEANIIENLRPVMDRIYCIIVELHSKKARHFFKEVAACLEDNWVVEERGNLLTFHNHARNEVATN